MRLRKKWKLSVFLPLLLIDSVAKVCWCRRRYHSYSQPGQHHSLKKDLISVVVVDHQNGLLVVQLLDQKACLASYGSWFDYRSPNLNWPKLKEEASPSIPVWGVGKPLKEAGAGGSQVNFHCHHWVYSRYLCLLLNLNLRLSYLYHQKPSRKKV